MGASRSASKSETMAFPSRSPIRASASARSTCPISSSAIGTPTAAAVLLTLASRVAALDGLDLEAAPEPVRTLLEQRGFSATLARGSVYELPYDDAAFDLVVCFSVFEHLHEVERGLREVHRVLRP